MGEGISRLLSDPGMPRGCILPPSPASDPGRIPAWPSPLSQAPPGDSGPRRPGNSRSGRCRSRGVSGESPRLGHGRRPLPLGPDSLLPTGQLVWQARGCHRRLRPRWLAGVATAIVSPGPAIVYATPISGSHPGSRGMYRPGRNTKTASRSRRGGGDQRENPYLCDHFDIAVGHEL